jgi:hypothetical protein
VIGLALWVDQLILPVVAASLLLLFFCYREALWGGLCLVVGMIIGAFPLIIYNISAPPREDSLTILLYLSRTGADKVVAEHISTTQQLLGTFLISLPVATGVNACHRSNDLPLLRSPTDSLSCIMLQATWATGLTLLWGIAVLLACIAVWHQWSRTPTQEQSFEKRKSVIQHSARLLLLGSAALTFVLFARSPAAALYPVTSSRYLICLLLATPAVLWPLWRGLHGLDRLQARRTQMMLIGRVGILLLIGTTFLMGTITIFGDIPQNQEAYTKEDALIEDLLHLGATRIYSEYWTCNRLIFASDERIICASLDEKLRQGFDRYLPYRAIVKADPYAAYVFPLGSPQAMAFAELHKNDTQYRRDVFEGYVVYQREVQRTHWYSPYTLSMHELAGIGYNGK